MDKAKVSVEKMLGAKEALVVLEDLVQGFKAGRMTITEGEQSVTLVVPELLELELEAKQKKDKSKLVIELSWRTPVEVAPSASEEGAPKPCGGAVEGADAAPCASAPVEKPAESGAKTPGKAAAGGSEQPKK